MIGIADPLAIHHRGYSSAHCALCLMCLAGMKMMKPAKPIPLSRELEEAFLAKVQRDEELGCLFWMGYLDSQGYGCLWHKGTHYLAHRVAYCLHHSVETLPDGLITDHIPVHIVLLHGGGGIPQSWHRQSFGTHSKHRTMPHRAHKHKGRSTTTGGGVTSSYRRGSVARNRAARASLYAVRQRGHQRWPGRRGSAPHLLHGGVVTGLSLPAAVWASFAQHGLLQGTALLARQPGLADQVF